MRGRVDVSEGFPRSPGGLISSVNLIQQFQYGEGLSRLFSIKERSPTPTLGSEIVPVVVVDELRPGGYPPRRRAMAGVRFAPVGVNNVVLTVQCRGQIPSGNVQDKLVVHDIWLTQSVANPLLLSLFVGVGSGITGLLSQFATLNDSTLDQPNVGNRLSDFTSASFGESPDVLAGTPQLLVVPTSVQYRVPGPFIVGQGEAVAISTSALFAVGFLSAVFDCEEYPRP